MRIPEPWKRLFRIPDRHRSWWEVIVWWELRRIAYNLIVGTVGFLSALAILAIEALPPLLPREELNWAPGFPALVFGLGANFLYTGGWIAELLIRRLWQERARELGPQLFFLGLVFSILLSLFPAAANLAYWLWRVARH